jgi:hypothetical protein
MLKKELKIIFFCKEKRLWTLLLLQAKFYVDMGQIVWIFLNKIETIDKSWKRCFRYDEGIDNKD